MSRHLEYARPGGRAEKRVGDFVRRRKWTRAHSSGRRSSIDGVVHHIAQATSKAAQSIISPVTQMQGSK